MTRSSSLPLMSLSLALGLAGCTMDGVVILEGFGDRGPELGDETGGFETGDAGDDDGQDSGLGDDALDLPDDGGALIERSCTVGRGLDAPLPCEVPPASSSLDPVVEWTWTGPDGEDSIVVTPLVANLDDDNSDGGVDLCDTPELLVLAVDLPASKSEPLPAGHIYILDTQTGAPKRVFEHPLDATATPALADLDDDGEVEILAFERSEDILGSVGEHRVIAFEADGSVLWTSESWATAGGGGGLAIADLDADGSPEILAPEQVLRADGSVLWASDGPATANSLPVAADLDGDGLLEVLFGRSVYTLAGDTLELSFELELPAAAGKNTGVAAIANFDDDPEPEIYVHATNHRVFEHDGTFKVACGSGNVAGKDLPVSIADTDGDGRSEILANIGSWFRATHISTAGGQPTCQTLWSVKISDDTVGVGTAFDFLADGSAEAIYADLEWVRIFDEQGLPLAEIERHARPSMATPVVADADNDGAAELIIVGSEPEGGDGELVTRPSVLYIQNADDRFAPTRRIWNQHAYHATNIREDATVPLMEPQHWLVGQNGFRTNPAPSYAGQLCQPPAIE
jgi:hypothetical protein